MAFTTRIFEIRTLNHSDTSPSVIVRGNGSAPAGRAVRVRSGDPGRYEDVTVGMAQLWTELLADRVEARHPDATNPILCASGISPSGPIHLGNLREVLTTHLVVEQLRGRGREARHLHFWDDIDRFRRVPAGLPATLEEFIGKPLSTVPDPSGEFLSLAERYIDGFRASLSTLGVGLEEHRQSLLYASGEYAAEVAIAMRRRHEIFDLLERHQTAGRHADAEKRREAYFPFQPYCANCGKDSTRIVGFDVDSLVCAYTCAACGEANQGVPGSPSLGGKLVWKVDWPMRWAHYGVDFEPGGEDHSGPQSSYAVGQSIVSAIFSGRAPVYAPYAFVGFSGQTKMSGSKGEVITPAVALSVLEPAVLRWLYIRRPADQSFSVDFDNNALLRLYEEWDRFCARVQSREADEREVLTHGLATETSSGPVRQSPRRSSFRLLASTADLTQGNREQMLRIIQDHEGDRAIAEQDLEPRITCAVNWVTTLLPEADRVHLRDEFAESAFADLTPQLQEMVAHLAGHLEDDWSLDGLTTLVYGIPKLTAGLPADAPPTPELKRAQREFFVALYRLLCDSETGPRLPTLFLSIGADRVRRLLGGPGVVAKPIA